MTRPRGFSLIEMLVVMAVGAVIMGVAVTLLYALIETEGSGRDHVRQSSVLGGLADQFRRDVHAARTVAGVARGEGRQFELAPDHTVTYRWQPGTVTRSEQVDGTVQRRESFTLPPGTTASIGIQADTPPEVVSLMLLPAAEAAGQPGGRAIRIDAVLARDHRFARSPGPVEEERE